MKARPRSAGLPRYLIEAQDEERQRIGRRLHDDFGQQLATISILLSTLKRGIPERDKARLEHIGGIREKLLALAESMRRLSHELDPTVVEHAGLAAALRMFSAELSTRPGLQVRFETSGALEILPLATARGLYRIAQDALRGVSEGQLELCLIRPARGVEFTIAAVGRAPAKALSRAVSGPALARLRQRAAAIGAALRVSDSAREFRLTVALRSTKPEDRSQKSEVRSRAATRAGAGLRFGAGAQSG
jgi:signal transduction histidine kinase